MVGAMSISLHNTISPQNPEMDLAAFTDEYRSKFEPEQFSNLVETNFRFTVVQKQQILSRSILIIFLYILLDMCVITNTKLPGCDVTSLPTNI